jgi:hypothetical protein
MNQSDFARQYERLTDDELAALNPADLVPEAQAAFQSELRRRADPQNQQAEQRRIEATKKSRRLIQPVSAGRKRVATAIWIGINLAAVLYVIQEHAGLPFEAFEYWIYPVALGLVIISGWPLKREGGT